MKKSDSLLRFDFTRTIVLRRSDYRDIAIGELYTELFDFNFSNIIYETLYLVGFIPSSYLYDYGTAPGNRKMLSPYIYNVNHYTVFDFDPSFQIGDPGIIDDITGYDNNHFVLNHNSEYDLMYRPILLPKNYTLKINTNVCITDYVPVGSTVRWYVYLMFVFGFAKY